MASLLELQRAFAAALHDPRAACAVSPPENLAIYRNNAEFAFRHALEVGFPVLRRRVGDDYFRQLASQYRRVFPSRSGDLHWAGRDLAEFLTNYLAGGEYAWLADLARLEWACEEAAVEGEVDAMRADSLAPFAAEDLERLKFALQPSLRLIASPFPIFSVWRANQTANAPPVNQSVGPEHGLVHSRSGEVEVRVLDHDLFNYLEATRKGATLGEAIQMAALEERRLTEILGLLFSERLVVSMALEEAPRQGS
jgi:hypothetical protein